MPAELPESGLAKIAEGPGGLEVLSIDAPFAQARVFLQGAQLTHWQPRGAEPVIFLSGQSAFEPGKAIRGGVPICFPWFGPKDGQSAHGFARNLPWELTEVIAEGAGARATFALASNAETLRRWPHPFEARMVYAIGERLEMTFEVTNSGPEPFSYSEALHTYFVVGDIHQVRITGLDGAEYRDFPDRAKLSRQQGAIVFTGETDRVYVNTTATCVLEDPSMRRRIVVEKSGSGSTTVWNPWIGKSAALSDFGNDEWQRMACIETVNAFENSVTLAPGEMHRTVARISVEARP